MPLYPITRRVTLINVYIPSNAIATVLALSMAASLRIEDTNRPLNNRDAKKIR